MSSEAGLIAYLQASAPAKAAVLLQNIDTWRRQDRDGPVGKGIDVRRKPRMNAFI